jgi:LytS/YehU family sensor histidine kinase
MLYECNEKQVPLSKELTYLENYISLEKLRQSKNVDIQFIVEGVIENQTIAPLIFISFLENAFKHGLNNILDAGFVHVYFKVDKELIHCTLENSKPEKPANGNNKKVGGIGLENVQKRLEMIYPNNHSLKIKETDETFRVDIDIRFIE